MGSHKYGLELADDDLLETIADLIAAGETVDGDDGLTAAQIAAELPFARKTVAKHCSDLVAEGRLECGWGFVDGRPIRSYRPTEGRRVMTDGGQSEGGTARGVCNECGCVFDLIDVNPDEMVCPECNSRDWVNEQRSLETDTDPTEGDQ